MNSQARLIEYPHFVTYGDGIQTEKGSPYIVRIAYQNSSVIILEERIQGYKYGVRVDEFFIRKSRLLYPKELYKGTTDYSSVDWLSSELPFDVKSKTPAWKTLMFMFRAWLCSYFNLEIISPLQNHEFEEYFAVWREPETSNLNPQRVPYLRDIPSDFMPSLFLTITAATALTCSSATDFESLLSEVIRKTERWRDKHDDRLLSMIFQPLG